MTQLTQEIQNHWLAIQPIFSISSDRAYDRAVACLNDLLDEIGTDESHPLYNFLDTLATLVHIYEEEHHPVPDCSGAEVLQFLMT